MFHAVQHDECDDDDVAKWYDYPAGKAPILVNQSTYETICESENDLDLREKEKCWIKREKKNWIKRQTKTPWKITKAIKSITLELHRLGMVLWNFINAPGWSSQQISNKGINKH